MILQPKELQRWIEEKRPFTVVDVRTDEQRNQCPLQGLTPVISKIDDIPVAGDRPLVLVCQFGIITEEVITEGKLENTFSLLGGAQAWNEFYQARIDLSRWSRQMVLPELGVSGQQKIHQAAVAIVGLGGLGCSAALTLAAAGIGKLILIDGDHVELSNLHRQIIYREEDQGKKKVMVVAERLKAVNSRLKVKVCPQYLTEEVAETFLDGVNVIIDATDNVKARRDLDRISRNRGVPLVYGGLYRFEGQVAVLNLNGSPSYEEVFPAGGEDGACEGRGVLGMLPGIIGNIQALEAVKIIAGITPNLAGRLLLYDGLTQTMETIDLTRAPEGVV